MDELKKDGFFELPSAVNCAGVYALIYQGKVVYVGQSTTVYARIARHRSDMKRRLRRSLRLNDPTFVIVFDSVWVRICKPEHLDYLEVQYINQFKPEGNTLLRRDDLPDVKVDLEELGVKDTWTKKPKPSSNGSIRRF